jgi:hypothetical protein
MRTALHASDDAVSVERRSLLVEAGCYRAAIEAVNRDSV